MTRTLLNESSIAQYFLAEVVFTSCYIINRVYVRPFTQKIAYELYKVRKPNVFSFHVFGSKCYIKMMRQNLGKFD